MDDDGDDDEDEDDGDDDGDDDSCYVYVFSLCFRTGSHCNVLGMCGDVGRNWTIAGAKPQPKWG